MAARARGDEPASRRSEGEVYRRLLEKLEEARKALGGKVYDVLGELFEGQALRDLLVEANSAKHLPTRWRSVLGSAHNRCRRRGIRA